MCSLKVLIEKAEQLSLLYQTGHLPRFLKGTGDIARHLAVSAFMVVSAGQVW